MQFKTRQEVLDALSAAYVVRENALDAWFEVSDAASDECEVARAYKDANAEVNRLIAIDHVFVAK